VSEGVEAMYQIKDEDERQKTLERIEGLKAQIERVRQKHGPKGSRNFQIIAERRIKEFEEQVKVYAHLKQRNYPAT